MRSLLLPLVAAVVVAPTAPAQELRDYQVGRGRRSEQSLRAIIDFAAGDLFIRQSSDRSLFRMDLKYDPVRYQPIDSWDADRLTVRLGVDKRGDRDSWPRKDPLTQRAVIELSPDVDLTLEANLGATESSLELGGLRLEDLLLTTGASDTELRFSKPNKMLCRRAQVTTGAAAFVATNIGNAGCRAWLIEGGVGQVRLDLDGEWPEDARMQIRMTVGAIRLEAPRSLGIRITMDRFLASFSHAGFSRSGKTYLSENYDRATRKVDLDIETTLGNVKVEWK